MPVEIGGSMTSCPGDEVAFTADERGYRLTAMRNVDFAGALSAATARRAQEAVRSFDVALPRLGVAVPPA
ncbi:MAG: hypothetical protein ACRDF0_08105 [Candidatus Limnocylindria bacterium]